MATLAEIVDAGVAHHGASNDCVLTVEHEKVVGGGESGLAILASLYIAQVTVMTDFHTGTAMDLALGVPVGASGGASIRQVA